MIKKILFISSVFVAGLVSAQSFQLRDYQTDLSIDGMSHTERGTTQELDDTKFYVKNLTSSTATYSAKAYEISNPKATGLQICYGTNCFTANAGVSGAQTNTGTVSLAGSQKDTTFKVAPFTFTWGSGDSAVWRITVYNTTNSSDSSSAIITWKEGFPVSIKQEVSQDDVALSAYPNPVSNILTVNYNVDTDVSANVSIDVFDVVGKKVATHKVVNKKGQVRLDVSGFNAGVYFYSLNVNGKAIKTERIIIN